MGACAVSEIRIEPTKFTVCGLPEDDVDSSVWSLSVEHRGPGDRWAVCRMSYCLSTDGEWDIEPIPSYRTDEWKSTHRFPLEEARRLAVEMYPKLIINGWWVRDGKLVRANG